MPLRKILVYIIKQTVHLDPVPSFRRVGSPEEEFQLIVGKIAFERQRESVLQAFEFSTVIIVCIEPPEPLVKVL